MPTPTLLHHSSHLSGLLLPIFQLHHQCHYRHHLAPHDNSTHCRGRTIPLSCNSFVFALTILQPLFSQIANIFGRRNPMSLSVALFALGSGLSGGSKNPARLIASRTVQGTGTGGLYVLSEIIICDLMPPRHRGPYLSAVISTAAIGTTNRPIIGGALAQVQWRWIFWLNLPISGIGLFCNSVPP